MSWASVADCAAGGASSSGGQAFVIEKTCGSWAHHSIHLVWRPKYPPFVSVSGHLCCRTVLQRQAD